MLAPQSTQFSDKYAFCMYMQAAHLMVSSLAGSLALVTCKEPLRVSLSNQLRVLLQQVPQSGLDQAALEQTVQTIVNDNLEVWSWSLCPPHVTSRGESQLFDSDSDESVSSLQNAQRWTQQSSILENVLLGCPACLATRTDCWMTHALPSIHALRPPSDKWQQAWTLVAPDVRVL